MAVDVLGIAHRRRRRGVRDAGGQGGGGYGDESGGGGGGDDDDAMKLVNPASSFTARATTGERACSTSSTACAAWHWAMPRLAVLDAPSRIAVYSVGAGGSGHSGGGRRGASGSEVLALLQDDKRQANVQSLAWRPNAGSVLAAGCDFGALVVWSTRTARSPRLEAAALSAQRWHAQPSCVCALSGRVLSGDALRDRSRAGLLVRALTWSPCGSLLACGVCVDDFGSGGMSLRRASRSLAGHGMAIFCGASLLAARARTWGAMLAGEAPMRRLVMRGSTEEVASVSWSGDGGRVCAMANGDGGIWIWETITWKCVQWVSRGLDVELPLCLWGFGACDVLLTVANAPGPGQTDAVTESTIQRRGMRAYDTPVASLLYMARETPELDAVHAVEMKLPGLHSEKSAASTIITSMAMSESRLAVAMVAQSTEKAPRVAVYAISTQPVFVARLLEVIPFPASVDESSAIETDTVPTQRAPAVAIHATMGLLAVNWDAATSSIHELT